MTQMLSAADRPAGGGVHRPRPRLFNRTPGKGQLVTEQTAPTVLRDREAAEPSATRCSPPPDLSKRYAAVQALQDVSAHAHRRRDPRAGRRERLRQVDPGRHRQRHRRAPTPARSRSAAPRVAAARPGESQRHGAITVFQDGSVIPELTVAQNLYLGTRPAHRPAYREVNGWAGELLEEFGLRRMTPNSRPRRSRPPTVSCVEIARAMMARTEGAAARRGDLRARLAGVDIALELMRKPPPRGSAVLFVTHRLSEVFRVADRVSVLRDGQFQGTHDGRRRSTRQAGRADGRAPASTSSSPTASPDATATSCSTPRGSAAWATGRSTSSCGAGQIVGIAGADGNGQLPLLGGLAATRRRTAAPSRSADAAVKTFGQAGRRRRRLPLLRPPQRVALPDPRDRATTSSRRPRQALERRAS